MTQRRISPPQANRSFRERRLAAGRSIRALEQATGIHRAHLSMIERGLMPSLEEHAAIEAALVGWEEAAK
jgi:transcriptional regulator with XRE-family HTH domain